MVYCNSISKSSVCGYWMLRQIGGLRIDGNFLQEWVARRKNRESTEVAIGCP